MRREKERKEEKRRKEKKRREKKRKKSKNKKRKQMPREPLCGSWSLSPLVPRTALSVHCPDSPVRRSSFTLALLFTHMTWVRCHRHCSILLWAWWASEQKFPVRPKGGAVVQEGTTSSRDFCSKFSSLSFLVTYKIHPGNVGWWALHHRLPQGLNNAIVYKCA